MVAALERTADGQPVPKLGRKSSSVPIPALLNLVQSARVLQPVISQGIVQKTSRVGRKKTAKSKKNVSDRTEKHVAVSVLANASSGFAFEKLICEDEDKARKELCTHFGS